MQLKSIIAAIEAIAPLNYQESYDNAGLLVGNPQMEIHKALLCLDTTEAIVDEAIQIGANLIVAHHPIVFSGLKKLNGKNYVERVVMKAIKHDVAIYAAHTNLDNQLTGVNKAIADKLGLTNTRVLQPYADSLVKLVTFVPTAHLEHVREALFESGAGHIGHYEHCSFYQAGTGTFKGDSSSKPFAGVAGVEQQEQEYRLEVILPANRQNQVVETLLQAHPYEEVAYDLIALKNKQSTLGAGLIGVLPEPMPEISFLTLLKGQFNCKMIRHTSLLNREVSRVALCGGAGSFLLNAAKQAAADVFVSGDFKYHEFFDAEKDILIADIGHYESEQFTINIFYDLFKEKFPTFAVQKTNLNTNPINYL